MFIYKEPYSTSLLLSLPPELVEYIAADINSPADLLNLALICKALHDIIVPFHLHFRKLSLNISKTRLALWSGIIVKPRLASCFHTVHAHYSPDEQGEFYPPILLQEGEAYLARTVTSPERVHILCNAISRLTGLVKFNYTTPKWITKSQILWTLSTSCPLIQEVILHHIRDISTTNITPPELQSSLVSFPSLQSLIVNFNHIENDDLLLCFEIVSFGCFPKLKALRLLNIYINPNKPGPPATAVLINSAILPQLREFTLTVYPNVSYWDMTNEAKADMAYRFLARHPQLESLAVLSFPGDFWQPLSLERDHCPNVRVLCVGTQVIDAFSSSLAGQRQKLSGSIGPRFFPLLEHISMLQERVLHITDYLPVSFIRSLPISIQRIVVTGRPEIYSTLCINANRYQTNSAQLEYIINLTRLHNLTHIGGFNWTQSSIAEEKYHFLKLFALKKLEYIGIEVAGSPLMWIPLQTLKDGGFAPEKKHLTHSQCYRNLLGLYPPIRSLAIALPPPVFLLYLATKKSNPSIFFYDSLNLRSNGLLSGKIRARQTGSTKCESSTPIKRRDNFSVLATATMAFEWKTKSKEAQAKLHDLQLEKKNLEEHHSEATSLLAPIRRLPDGILGRVLLFVIPDARASGPKPAQAGPHKPRPSRAEPCKARPPGLGLRFSRLRLLRFCHRWKRVLYECPAVWTSIIVNSQVPLHITQRSLQLSKAKLLDVYISGQCRDKDAKETAALLVPYLPQIVRRALLWPPMAAILSSLPTGQKHPLRSLKSLYIRRTSQAIANLDLSTVEQLITP
ncbi:hypothetical protein M422DRAFT_275168 [Sphaerobolus stellatus SS14]|uniref:F-box domain-containing protein n=1 Tax=Sphaerobolus stellatus (strain SS14) TaxID=990650 RepID=A0A0C9UF68_SPHS4|nr:hypothetical protein M422DRAFT_275168 [Sphaerobolus stellatus SS14]